ncbi:hypothetical protein RND71_035601 [Anisodus tanguticus]|uniref:Uncharacterized protein n=1 Tax=Anisodus tanguticus TaxID=243964 RepID=A0AAE1R4S9_9SOLA|nr:hypothetical protein RND71_035601 [Anisodus tanguticus]
MDETGVHSLLNAKKPIVPGIGTTSPVQTVARHASMSSECSSQKGKDIKCSCHHATTPPHRSRAHGAHGAHIPPLA